jgi:hypothetical protein
VAGWQAVARSAGRARTELIVRQLDAAAKAQARQLCFYRQGVGRLAAAAARRGRLARAFSSWRGAVGGGGAGGGVLEASLARAAEQTEELVRAAPATATAAAATTRTLGQLELSARGRRVRCGSSAAR